jgi:hypothetical protein
MPPDLTSIWSLLLALLVPIIKLIDALGNYRDKKPAQDHSLTGRMKTISVQNIRQREPNRHPPAYVSLVPVIGAFLLLAFGIWAIYMWTTGTVTFQVNVHTVLFFVGFSVAFLGFPLFVVIDYFHVQPKYYRRGRSHVAKEAIVTVANDADTVFDACYRVLNSMQAAIIILERPNLFKAKVRNSVMTIVIRQIEESKVSVHTVSDSKWLTVRWDLGGNQKNVDDFLRELGKQ